MALSKIPVVPGTKTLARGSVVIGNASGEPSALAIGSNTYVLKSDGTDISWGADAGGAALTGSTNNTVVTVTGANAIQGETNFIYNGTIVGAGADGANADLGSGIHIKKADSGASALADANALVIESDADTGLSILQHTGGNGTIAFGDSDDNNIGMIQYYHGSVNAMTFHTQGAERMRILNDGTVNISTTGSVGSNQGGIHVSRGNGQNGTIAYLDSASTSYDANIINEYCAATSTNSTFNFIRSQSGNGVVFVVRDSGNVQNTNNSYGAYSDERIKQNITDANSQWDDIKALKIRNFKLKSDPTKTQLGVVAQELETANMNGLVEEAKPEKEHVAYHSDFGTIEDGTADNGATPIKDEDDNITGYEDVFTKGQKVKSVKYSVLYMKAIKALQESMERIEQLEAKVTALENA